MHRRPTSVPVIAGAPARLPAALFAAKRRREFVGVIIVLARGLILDRSNLVVARLKYRPQRKLYYKRPARDLER